MTITSGTLSAVDHLGVTSHAITMQGVSWAGGPAGVGFFNPGTGTVVFTGTSGILNITGDDTWYNFTCTTDSKIFHFEHLKTQTILAGGNFNVHASSSATPIVLTTDNPIAAAYASPPPDLQGQWVINNLSAVAQNIDNVDVSWSYALVSITPGPGAKDSGNNFNWNFVIPILASWTVDSNNNGRIDRIRVQVKAGNPAQQLLRQLPGGGQRLCRGQLPGGGPARPTRMCSTSS